MPRVAAGIARSHRHFPIKIPFTLKGIPVFLHEIFELFECSPQELTYASVHELSNFHLACLKIVEISNSFKSRQWDKARKFSEKLYNNGSRQWMAPTYICLKINFRKQTHFSCYIDFHHIGALKFSTKTTLEFSSAILNISWEGSKDWAGEEKRFCSLRSRSLF